MNQQQKRRRIAGGLPCPKCHELMQRSEHGDAWRPKPRQPYYFSFWDKCRCGHFQHYEAAKVWLKKPRKKQPAPQTPEATVAAAADRHKILAMFDMDDFDRALLK